VISDGLQELLRELWQEEQRKAVTPWRFHMCLTQNAPSLVKKAFRAPQDAQEFLLFVINALHEELDSNGVMNGVAAEQEEESRLMRTKSAAMRQGPITSCFRGQLQSALACATCGFTSKTREEFFHLSLTVPRDVEQATLEELLIAEFATEERLAGEDRWRCERCDDLREATRRAQLHRLPPVIMLHLKRFAYTPSGQVRKVRTPVVLPGEGVSKGLDALDFGRFATSSSAQEPHPAKPDTVLYDVISIVNHHGRDAVCGHYTAHCRHCVDGRWYSFNDDTVVAVDREEVWLPEEAYILCLVRRDAFAERPSI